MPFIYTTESHNTLLVRWQFLFATKVVCERKVGRWLSFVIARIWDVQVKAVAKNRSALFWASNQVVNILWGINLLHIQWEKECSAVKIANIHAKVRLLPGVMSKPANSFIEFGAHQDKSVFDVVTISVELFRLEIMLGGLEYPLYFQRILQWVKEEPHLWYITFNFFQNAWVLL